MAIVMPFVQVGTYPTRNFATLGAPEHIQLAHQCRFAVRSASDWGLEAFLGSTSDHFAAVAARVFALEMRLRICLQTSYAKQPGLPTPG